MRLFTCQACSQLLYFENKRCERCEHKLGYIANDFVLTALEATDGETWTALAKSDRAGAPRPGGSARMPSWTPATGWSRRRARTGIAPHAATTGPCRT